MAHLLKPYDPDNLAPYLRLLAKPPAPKKTAPRTPPRRRHDPDLALVLDAIDRSGLRDYHIAARAGLSQPVISHWRSGRVASPRHASMTRVLNVLGLEFEILRAERRKKAGLTVV